MELTFSSIDEVKEFVKQLKGTRGGKGEKDEADAPPPPAATVPAPMSPPPPQPQAFAPPVQNAAPVMAFPAAAAAPAVPPEVAAIVARIVTRIDGAVASGQPTDAVLAWFRSNIGIPEAANATMDQIKQVYLTKASMPVLENIAKLMAA